MNDIKCQHYNRRVVIIQPFIKPSNERLEAETIIWCSKEKHNDRDDVRCLGIKSFCDIDREATIKMLKLKEEL